MYQNPLNPTIERAPYPSLIQQPLRRFGRGTGTRRLSRRLIHLLARGDSLGEEIFLPGGFMLGVCCGGDQRLRIGGEVGCIELYEEFSLAYAFSDLHRDRAHHCIGWCREQSRTARERHETASESDDLRDRVLRYRADPYRHQRSRFGLVAGFLAAGRNHGHDCETDLPPHRATPARRFHSATASLYKSTSST